MKKMLSILLLLVLTFSLAGCGKDYSKHNITFFGNDFRWDMTPEEAMEYIRSEQLYSKEIECSDYDTWSTVSDGYYFFRFDAEDKIEFVKIDMGYDTGMVSILNEWYGQWDEYDADAFNSYIWYGTMAGQNIKMTFYSPDSSYLEFMPE